MATLNFNASVSGQKKHRALAFSILLILCGITLFQGITIPFNEPLADALGYVRVASEIIENHTLTNFGMSEEAGRFFPPLYPAFVSLPGFFDDAYRQTLDCYNHENVSICKPDALQSLGIMQAFLISLLLVAVYRITKIIVGETSIAILATILFKFGSKIDNYMHESLTEVLQFTLFSFVILGILMLLTKRGISLFYSVFIGVFFGALVLTRGSYLYLAYVLLPLVFFIKSRLENLSLAEVLRLAIFISGSMLAILSIWMLRNILIFGDPAISSGYAPFIFIQRLAYNDMQFSEWLASFVFWFPDIGDNIARQYLPYESYVRLGWEAEETFYQAGQRDRINLFSTGAEHVSMKPLLLDRLFPDLFWHCMVTIALSFRGMFAGGYLSVFGLISSYWALIYLHKINRLWLFGVLMFILFFMLGFHGFFTVSIVRYNELLALFYAICFAIPLQNIWRKIHRRFLFNMMEKR